jgi:hypothetical protein
MKLRLKTFLDESKRIYQSIFEDRLVADIQTDYYTDKWISKSDLLKMYEFEKTELYKIYSETKQDLHDLKQSFNLNAMANYERLERHEQGKITNSFKPKQ